MKTCPKCNTDKTDDCFYKRSSKGGLASYCKGCSNRFRAGYKYSHTLRGRLSIRASSARQKTTDSDITVAFLMELHTHQNGLCHYTREPLGLEVKKRGRHLNALSLDRIDPARGYYQDNVVLCCWIANVMKQARTVDEFISLCREVVDHHDNRGSV